MGASRHAQPRSLADGALLRLVILVGASPSQSSGESVCDGWLNVADADHCHALAPDGIVQSRKLAADVKAGVLKRKRQAVCRTPRRILSCPVRLRHPLSRHRSQTAPSLPGR